MATNKSLPQFQLDDLGRLLFQTMRKKNLTAQQLAQQIGCHRSLLYRWLNGECLPHKPAYIQGIAQASGCELPALLNMMAGAQAQLHASPLGERLHVALSQVREPADLDQGLGLIAEVFQAEEAELFLISPIAVSCLWRAGLHPFDPARIGVLVRLYSYMVDWRSWAPRTVEEALARCFVLDQVVEFAEPQHPPSWLAAVPLWCGQQKLGCLVLRGAARPGLNPAETVLLREASSCLAEEVVGAHHQIFDSLGRMYAVRVLADLYRELRGEELPLQKGKSPVGALVEQAEELGQTLLSLARHLRQIEVPFNGLSIQHIEPDTGTMLAIGTIHSGHLLPPVLLDTSTALPCWEAFKTGKIVYRPDLSKTNPYHEGDPSQSYAVQAIADLPFAWGQNQGTVGINSFKPNPWSERDLQQIAELLSHFHPRKKPAS